MTRERTVLFLLAVTLHPPVGTAQPPAPTTAGAREATGRIEVPPPPTVVEQKFHLAPWSPTTAERLIREALVEVRHRMVAAHPLPAGRRVRIGIASPVDEGGWLKPTRLTNWTYSMLHNVAIDAGLAPLPSLVAPAPTPRQLELRGSVIDALLGEPGELASPGRWEEIRARLAEQKRDSTDCLMYSRVKLGADRKSVQINYAFIDLLARPPAVLMADQWSLELDSRVPKAADVYLVLDESGSMEKNDPRRYRTAAAKALVRELVAHARDPSIDYRVATIFFNDDVLPFSVTQALSLREPDAERRLIGSIEHASAASRTNLDKPFDLLLEQLRAASADRAVVVLFFTDGNHTDGTLRRAWRRIGAVTQSTVRMMYGTAIALGDETEPAVLGDIAASLGGATYVRRIDPASLGQELYRTYFATLSMVEQLTLLGDGRAEPGAPLKVRPGPTRGANIISIQPSARRKQAGPRITGGPGL